ncbi:MAG: alanine racemase [Candidatus Velthaea sp.]
MLAELTIDVGAIRANIAALKALVAPARVAAVIKANAYGHGAVDVARGISDEVDRLCVYELAEAVVLREAGITARIHVLGPVPAGELDVAHAAGVELTLWDRGSYAAQVASIARRRHAPFTIHAKIDTGVTRLGVAAAEAPHALARYAAQPEYRIAGVFSHLAAAEELDSTYTHEQLARFLAATDGFDPGVERHIAASAAAMLWPETRLGSIRAGIAIYGIWPSAPTAEIMRERGLALQPALSWRTRIVLVHDVPAGTSVGYGCTYQTRRASRIGVLPIGYAEGLPRAASGRALVLAGGMRVPLVGRVCMNMAFVDLTDVPQTECGSIVTLIGMDGSESIDANEAAAWSDTIGYELVTRLPARVPRRYC